MIAIISFLLIVLFSILIIRIGSIALEMTGLSEDVSRFQAQSAYTGVGFTTSEAEYVVSHPVRRKIIQTMMFLGSAGIASAVVTLILTFVGNTQEEATNNLIILFSGMILLYGFSKSKYIEKIMRRIIVYSLSRFTELRVKDYHQLLGLGKGYGVSEFKVKSESWMAGKKLRELELNNEGVLVLGIYRKVGGDECFIGAPNGDTMILAGDIVVCYGHLSVLERLKDRMKGKEGDEEHRTEVIKAEARRAEEIELQK